MPLAAPCADGFWGHDPVMSLDLDLSITRGTFTMDVAFQTAASGITALFGVSGSGKTTLGQAIGGFLKPARGRIAVNQRSLFDADRGIDIKPEARRVGFVFQDSRLFPHLSVEANLQYGLKRAGARNADANTPEITALLGLDGLLNRRPGGLSGGERQRVAIGRALLSMPDILVMDEPLAALDSARRGEIVDYIAALKTRIGLPIIYISHSVDEVARLADHMIVLDHGQVLASGLVADVFASPHVVERIAADGWGALIDGRIAGRDLSSGLTEIAFPGGRIKVPPIAAALGTKVRLRIPARDVIIALQPVTGLSVQNDLPARIDDLRPVLNGQVDVYLALGPTRLIARITEGAVKRLDLRPGMAVHALVKSVACDRVM
jgi:molybdate transport system ATP-binding protein